MRDAPILLIGGSGIVGRWTAKLLRDANPEAPLLIGGRDLGKAGQVAAEISQAEGVAVDLGADDLGLGDRSIGAVAIFLKDDRLAALRFAQVRGVPHIGISSGTFEIGPEVSAFIHHPRAAPVVLGSEWLAGAAVLATLHLARKFARVTDIVIDAVLDEEDIGGPAADIDMHRLTQLAPAALTRREGNFHWRNGDEAKAVIRAVDGEAMEAFAYSPLDIAALAAVTHAPNIQLNVSVGMSSNRRRGGPMSTEIIITLSGKTPEGGPHRERHAIVHPQGQAPVTALGVAMMLERLTGLDGKPATTAGVYFPEQLIDPDAYLRRLAAIGGSFTRMEDAR
ncbi:MAG TPA: hypothetical protein VHL31_07065 [Geminicoccus sp.]|jgi:hypothetical protein|uniref:hypothetical protein n=1 Tax=Geminicoccus sp. TaxID=2024832 RepID=UPI002E360640|nr:hypothetical protein [Geminicoccus sp.]HEX2526047.1 hypothetical protein [Geminicoccus sp.]